MSPPSFDAGDEPLADDFQFLVPLRAIKPSDVAIANNAVVVADADLVLTVVANAEYEVTVHCIYTAGATGLLQVGFSGPTAATMDWSVLGLANSVTASDSGLYTALSRTIADTKNLGASGAGTPVVARVEGYLLTGANAGSLTFKWAQAVSNATGTTVKANSRMIARRTF